MNRKNIIILALSIFALVCLFFTILGIRGEIAETLVVLKTANYFWLLLIIPNLIAMFFCAGLIWAPFVSKRYGISKIELAKMQYEQNFITTATPVGEITGLVYIVERMKTLGVPASLAGAMYVLRYIVSIGTNLAGMLVALAILTCMDKIQNINILPLITVTIIVILALMTFVFGIITLTGKIRFKNESLNKKIIALHNAFKIIQTDKNALLSSIIAGAFYTLFEDLPFLLVALTLRNPGIFLEIIIAGVAGNFADVIVPNPGAVGGFEAAMIWLLGGMGVKVNIATTIVVVERLVFIIISTITGYPFFQKGLLSINQPTKSSN